MDNGGGMTPETLHKMLGFGHSDKKEINGHRCVSFVDFWSTYLSKNAHKIVNASTVSWCRPIGKYGSG